MARKLPTAADVEWTIAAMEHDTACPQRGACPSTETYYAAYTAWWDKRIALEKTAPGVRVTAADVAAYEATRNQ